MITLDDANMEMYKRTIQNNIEHLTDGEYIDPDGLIEQMHENYRMALDGICGIKYLTKYINPDKKLEDYYRCLRSFVILWPKHKDSINVNRYKYFRDRFDFTLYDIRNFYYKGESKIVIHDEDKRFLRRFGNDKKGFHTFIQEFGYSKFLCENDELKNLGEDGCSPIKSFDDYKFNKVVNMLYLDNLYDLLNSNS